MRKWPEQHKKGGITKTLPVNEGSGSLIIETLVSPNTSAMLEFQRKA